MINKKNIIIINSHADNRGDESAQRNMIGSLLESRKDLNIDVLTISPNGLDLQEHIKVYRTIKFSNYKLPYIIFWSIFLKYGIRLPMIKKDTYKFELIEKILNSDIVVSSPGGPYLGDLYKSHEINEHLLQIYLATIFNKPVMIYAPSMGPFRDRIRNVIRKWVLNKCRIITVRDKTSYGYLKSLNLKNVKIVLTADAAFQNRPKVNVNIVDKIITDIFDDKRFKDKDRILVGFTPAGAKWNYRGYDNKIKSQDRYIEQIARALDKIIASKKAEIVIFPQLYGRISDKGLIEDIVKKVKQKKYIRVIPYEYDSEIQQEIIKKMDFFIGNRYHSVIFSLNNEIPVLCLSYEHKSSSIMNSFGLGEYVIDIEDFDEDILINKFNTLIENAGEVKKMIGKNYNTIRERSQLNNKLLINMIDVS